MSQDIQNLRRDYGDRGIDPADLGDDPMAQFMLWFDEARESDSGIYEPNAMTLATVDANGRPAARVVLLKEVTGGGFVFYTNYESRKAQEMETSAGAALTFWWDRMHRQVRVEGHVSRVSAAESDAYFNSRPVGSRLGAMASDQSRVIDSREVLEARMRELETTYETADPERPESWGGYRVVPDVVEFWQGRTSRLHDRVQYRRDVTDTTQWVKLRLAP